MFEWFSFYFWIIYFQITLILLDLISVFFKFSQKFDVRFHLLSFKLSSELLIVNFLTF